jgi:hypothetical protein
MKVQGSTSLSKFPIVTLPFKLDSSLNLGTCALVMYEWPMVAEPSCKYSVTFPPNTLSYQGLLLTTGSLGSTSLNP